MRIGIAIDVSTDVSEDFLASHGVVVLPCAITALGETRRYGRDLAEGLPFYRDVLPRAGSRAETTPLSVAETEQLFLSRLVSDYDYVFVITLSAARSETFDHAHKASYAILQRYEAVRASRGETGPFALRVIDSQSVFTGPGLLAWEAQRLIARGCSPSDIRRQLDDLIPHLHVYLVPQDLRIAWARAWRRGERGVSRGRMWLSQALALKPVLHIHANRTRRVAVARPQSEAVRRLFRHAAAQIDSGLLIPLIGISYGGDPAEITRFPGYAELAEVADAAGVALMTSMMAPATAVNMGGGALSLAYCARHPLVV
jgi:DegV family protein with EDD domain